MKKIILTVLVFISTFGYSQVKPAEKGVVYGSPINTKDVISVDDLEKKLEDETQYTGKVTGKVVSVCQERGCWMKLTKTDGENIMIRFKDYKFFVPKNIDGKEVVLS